MPRLFVVSGLPGAGKTTLARALSQFHGAVHLQTDEWLSAQRLDLLDATLRRRTERMLWRHAQVLLDAGVDVILDFGAWSRLERERFRRGARGLGAEVELHCLDVPLEVRVRRVAARAASRSGAYGAAAEPTATQQRDWQERYWQPADDAERASYDSPLPLPPLLPGA